MRVFMVPLVILSASCDMAVEFPSEIAKDRPFDQMSEKAALTCTGDVVHFGMGAGPCPSYQDDGSPEICFTEGKAVVTLTLTCTETSGIGGYLTGVSAALHTDDIHVIRTWSRRTPVDNRVEPGGTLTLSMELTLNGSDATDWDASGVYSPPYRDGGAEGTIRVTVEGVDHQGQPISTYPPVTVAAVLGTGSSLTGCWCDNTPDICDAGDASASGLSNAKKCTANKCPCDPNCTGGAQPCVEDGYCDTWCPSAGGTNYDPDCTSFANPYCK